MLLHVVVVVLVLSGARGRRNGRNDGLLLDNDLVAVRDVVLPKSEALVNNVVLVCEPNTGRIKGVALAVGTKNGPNNPPLLYVKGGRFAINANDGDGNGLSGVLVLKEVDVDDVVVLDVELKCSHLGRKLDAMIHKIIETNINVLLLAIALKGTTEWGGFVDKEIKGWEFGGLKCNFDFGAI